MTDKLSRALRAALVGVAGSAAADHLLLRGSVALTQWTSLSRTPNDIDFLSVVPLPSLPLEDLVRSVNSALMSVGYEVRGVQTSQTWPDTEFPGLRLCFEVASNEANAVQIDIGFGDPIVGPEHVFATESGPQLRMAGPVLSFSWKLHGLFEFGRGRWDAKTLMDLWLLATEVLSDPMAAEMSEAIALAFWSHHHDIDLMLPFLEEIEWGQGRKNRRQWRALTDKYAYLPSLSEALGVLRSIVEPLVRGVISDVRAGVVPQPEFLVASSSLLDPIVRVGTPAQLRSALAGIDRRKPLWVAWPKVTSSVFSEIGQTEVRVQAAELGLYDAEALSLDRDWTALRFEPRGVGGTL
jgi:Nucleotidyl transferase AbiEii toxin, Type IV TA system